MIEVWHLKDDVSAQVRLAINWIADDDLPEVQKIWDDGHYEKVAEVATDDREVAWILTNNINTSWSLEPDPRVTVFAPLHVINGKTYGHKSSSVGDILVENGVRYVVAPIGYLILQA
jgi:hypothetical protein